MRSTDGSDAAAPISLTTFGPQAGVGACDFRSTTASADTRSRSRFDTRPARSLADAA